MPYIKIKKVTKKKLKARKNNKFLPKHINYVDYKNTDLLGKFINTHKKIIPARVSGLTANQQRAMTLAIKRARFMALIPYYVDRIKK